MPLTRPATVDVERSGRPRSARPNSAHSDSLIGRMCYEDKEMARPCPRSVADRVDVFLKATINQTRYEYAEYFQQWVERIILLLHGRS